MYLFHQVEDAKAIVKLKGIYKQVNVYQRQGYLYAKHGSGYVALIKGVVSRVATSVPDMIVEALYFPDEIGDTIWSTQTGRLCLKDCPHKYKECKIENA